MICLPLYLFITDDGFPYSSCRRESYIIRLRGDDCEPRSVGRSVATKAFPHNHDDSTSGSGSSTGPGRRFPLVMDLGQETRGCY
jgi:hypothetical protein